MATMADIAKKVGVSKGTVSKALNGAPDVSETLRKTILETAVGLGYTRARRGAVRTLAVFIENMSCAQPEDFGTDIVTGFRQMAEPAGYEVRVIELNEALQKAAPFDEYMLQEGCLGALLLGLSLEDPWLKGFYTSHTPAVLYDNLVQPNPTVATLGMDNNEAIGQAVATLRAMGHCKVGYLSSALGSHIYRVRYQSFFNALRENGLPDDPDLAGTSFFSSETLDAHLPRLLEQGVTAILCSSDLLAHTVMIRCQELGLRVPQDISIVGFDDLPFCAHTAPPLSTIRQDRLQIGKSGFYALHSLLDGVPISSLLLHAQLILRGSTGPAPQSAPSPAKER
ncbi:MAG TPA: LacI family transcriptional regulator [Candidatus Gemmiger faecigallinarum]|nr:LacI family transcriptional regulator [Candidatus Gemmiger faecigallinarum]